MCRVTRPQRLRSRRLRLDCRSLRPVLVRLHLPRRSSSPDSFLRPQPAARSLQVTVVKRLRLHSGIVRDVTLNTLEYSGQAGSWEANRDVKSSRPTRPQGPIFWPRPRLWPGTTLASFSRRSASWPRGKSSKSGHE